ncbi:ABC transporter substrate-binding protein [Microbacterium sp. No. 7]|uniref:ABC transporter substrate-binding protein n=1 Tax=Microbacterium sp. No. 7 TaxID=1714373 RepID=UPI0006D1A71F|nr:sugar ABC transporter substrate-binding protein [Microbacterium sp. No. 7]ALJ21765.1 sugar ABC transporter substrate-binding protein [Microbacterium sp. No. 7]
MRTRTALTSTALLAAGMLLIAGCSSGGDNGSNGEGGGEAAAGEQKVFFLLPNTTTTRFENRDAPAFIEAMKEYAPNATVTVDNAEGDPTKQQQQVEDAVTRGADVIVFVSADANLAAGSLAVAAQAEVPVVLYEHDAVGGPAEAHVLFDALAVGQAQGERAAELIEGMAGDGLKVARIKGSPGEYGTNQYQKGQDEFLEPLIASGKIEVVCEQNITNWDPVAGQAFIEDCLAQNDNALDLIISMNDGLAGGAIAALTTQGLDGQVVVTGGQDANLNAVQYIVQGKQDNTVYKNLTDQARAAAQVVASILSGGGVPSEMVNGVVDNDFAEIPAVFLPVENVTIDNVGDVVEDGVWTWEEICQGAETVPVCADNLG